MKTITVNVSEVVYKEFQKYAKSRDRKTSEIIREAMENYWKEKIAGQTTLADLTPVSLGKILKNGFSKEDDLLEEMLNDRS